MPKKLIEVALPLEAINQESAREKSIRYGHPSTLHLWWARRPLAAARAVIWSSLVDDPSAHPDRFPTEEEQNAERQRLFGILEQLVKWENSNDPAILEKAKAEIMRSTDNNPPALLDPFAGGGAIPLEAQRLGLEAHAHDLNPVAVMINKAMIEIPPKFAGKPPINPEAQEGLAGGGQWKGAAGLAEDVRYYGEWMKQRAFERIGYLYPKVKVPKEQGGGEATVIAWIWVRTVKCPNPACGCEMPLAHSFTLSKKRESEAWIEPIFEGKRLSFKVHNKGRAELEGTVSRQGAVCASCGTPVEFPYIREEGKNGRMGARLCAVVAEGKGRRIYISPDEEQIIAAQVERPIVFPDAEIPHNPRDFKTPNYGLTHMADLFTSRQLTALTTFSNLVKEAQAKAEADAAEAGMKNDYVPLREGGVGAAAYGEAIGVYLAFGVSRMADIDNSLCSWEVTKTQVRHLFTKQSIPMLWDFGENNVFNRAAGDYTTSLGSIVKVLQRLGEASDSGFADQADAQSDCGLRNIMVSTDPPYYDNIGYADLSDFFYIWMRTILGDTYPNLFRTMLVPKVEELVATPYRFEGNVEKAKDFFEDGMLSTCKQIFQYSRNDIPVTIYYAYKQSDTEDNDGGKQTSSTGWETMLSAIIQAGFSITGTWPMRTELANRSIASGSNALASSIVLVCRKRPADAPICTRRELVTALKRELRPALQKLQASNIAPVDLAQSAIGPGMGVFSRYKQVLEADGSIMTVRSALQIINQELDRYFNDQDDALDSDSRLCVDLFTQYAFNSLKFGDADILARAKNTSVAKLAEKGILYAAKGEVHLLTRDEIPEKVNPGESNVWMLTQQMTRAMEKEGIEGCAKIANDILGIVIEHAKDLAYRLYTICERKGWAQEGYAYNALVVAWPEIQSRAAQLRMAEPVQMDLFSGEVFSGEV